MSAELYVGGGRTPGGPRMSSRRLFGSSDPAWTRPVFIEGRYRAPVHARMLAVYEHNPDGDTSIIGGLRQLDPGEDAPASR